MQQTFLREHPKKAMNQQLTELAAHFSFGENWAQFAAKIDQARIDEAEKSLVRLIGRSAIQGQRFLDLGSGSGLFSVAAMRLGCRQLLAVDIDPKCVETTRAMLQAHAPHAGWECRRLSVFELEPAKAGTFDVVYSWGVLHHTGAMRAAIASAAQLVAPGGRLALGLYHKTSFCSLWRIEKRLYSRASSRVQAGIRAAWIALARLRFALRGETLHEHIADYRGRGMDFYHDVHDWLGGYPYESISPEEAQLLMRELGFVPLRSFIYSCFGLLGSCCDEYCFVRPSCGIA